MRPLFRCHRLCEPRCHPFRRLRRPGPASAEPQNPCPATSGPAGGGVFHLWRYGGKQLGCQNGLRRLCPGLLIAGEGHPVPRVSCAAPSPVTPEKRLPSGWTNGAFVFPPVPSAAPRRVVPPMCCCPWAIWQGMPPGLSASPLVLRPPRRTSNIPCKPFLTLYPKERNICRTLSPSSPPSLQP